MFVQTLPPAADGADGAGTVCVVSEAYDVVTEMGGRRLTLREQAIAGLVVRGCTNRQIAARLNVSEHTVKVQMGKLFAKLGVKSRLQLAMRVLRG